MARCRAREPRISQNQSSGYSERLGDLAIGSAGDPAATESARAGSGSIDGGFDGDVHATRAIGKRTDEARVLIGKADLDAALDADLVWVQRGP
jgi:hypothetical protein